METILEAKPQPIEHRACERAAEVKDPDFDDLYRQCSPYVFNTCLGILGNPDDARDAAQETFVKLYQNLAGFRGESSPQTWLYRVAVNTCMDTLRKRKKSVPLDSVEWLQSDSRTEDTILEQSVRQALLKLKPQHRVLLVLFHFQQLSYVEIAETMGASVERVRTGLHRARKAFRTAWDDGGEDFEM